MINDAFQILHLQERRITTPLFRNARQAFIGEAYGHKFHSKYLVIDSNKHINENIFKQANICPVFIYHSKSYIFQEGESLYTYFLAKKDSDIVLCEEQVWKLLSQIVQALLVLRAAGLEHRHLKQYAIRRVSPDTFKLVYHPTMLSMQELVREGSYSWFQFYPAPEQLRDLSLQQQTSCVFSLAAMILNIMNPLDFRRDIYSKKDFSLNSQVVEEKLKNASIIYSAKLMEIIRRMIRQSSHQRMSLEQLLHLVEQVNPFEKKMQLTTSIKSIVSTKLQRAKEKSNSPPSLKKKEADTYKRKEYTPKVINFNRGTFGGRAEAEEQLGQRQAEKEPVHSQQAETRQPELQQQKYEIYSFNMKKEKTLRKNESDYPSGSGVKQNKRSYSDYFNTLKKGNKDSPESKESQQDTKAASGKARVYISTFPDSKSEEQERSQGYNEYMRCQNMSKQSNYPLSRIEEIDAYQSRYEEHRSQPHEEAKKDDYIRVQHLDGSSLRYTSSATSRLVQSQPQEHQIQTSMRQFQLRLNQSRLKLADCLEDPSFLAKKLGYQGVWINGNVYYGQFKNGRRNGFALQIFESNEYYYGHYKDDMFHGEGFYFWNNNEHFLGLFEAGTKKEGTWCGKNKYIGEIKENKRHGIGTYIYSNGSMYEGEWFMGKRHGSGIIIEPSGEKFIGTFKMGKKWGHGSYLVNGCRVNGVWDGDRSVGPCQIIYEDGRIYKGMISPEFEMHGQGELTFSTGSICKGQFLNDDFVFGEMIYRNGEHYVGQVKEMRRHGKGTYTYLDGREVTGTWRDNSLFSSTD